MRYRNEPHVERIIRMSTATSSRRRVRIEGDIHREDWRPLTADQWADLDVMQGLDLAVATGESHWIRAYGLETA